jgi:hypothetical protein
MSVVLTPIPAAARPVRAAYEAALLSRAGPMMAEVGKDGTTADGTNQSLSEPLREGLASLGVYPATFGDVTDADLAKVPPASVSQLLDIAELKLVSTVHGSFTAVDETISLGSIKVSQNRDAITGRLAALAGFCLSRYGYGLTAPRAGSIRVGADGGRGPTSPRSMAIRDEL